jgi:hypothetical protein
MLVLSRRRHAPTLPHVCTAGQGRRAAQVIAGYARGGAVD